MATREVVSLVLLILSLFQVARSQSNDAMWKYCSGKPADVVFLLDSSNSIWGPDFRRQLHFVKDVVSMFQIGENGTRVGLVTYNDRVDLQFNLKRYLDQPSMLRAIDNVQESHGYTTATDLALEFTRTYLFTPKGGGRPGVSKVIVVITDGKSRNVLRTLIQASRVKRGHVHLFAIGVGRGANHRELSRMASKPSSDYVFQVAGYTALDSLKNLLAIKTCQVTHPTPKPTTTRTTTTPAPTTTTTTTPTTTTTTTTTTTSTTPTTTTMTTTTTTPTTTTTETTEPPTTTTTTPPTTTTTTPTTTTTTPTSTTTTEPTTTTWVDLVRKACSGKMVDVVFALDNSDAVSHDDFWQMIRFIRDFALGLDIRQNATRIGLVLFSQFAQQGIELDEHEDIHGLVSHLYKMQMSQGRAQVSEMLRFVRTKTFRRSVVRKEAAQVVIVITASSSRKIHRTKKQAARARRSGLNFITIGVGDNVREEELRVITGADDNGKESSRVRILPPAPPISSLDDETAMMMQDLMMGDAPAAPAHLTFTAEQLMNSNNATGDGDNDNIVLNAATPGKNVLTPVETGLQEELFGEEEEEVTEEMLGVSEDGTLDPVSASTTSTSTTAAPPPSPVFLLKDFSQLEANLVDVVLQTCAAETIDDPVSDQPCGSRQEADLMFVVDSANAGKKNTRKAMDLIRSVAGDMEIDRDKIQLGLVSPDPCAPHDHQRSFNLSQHHSKDNLLTSLHTDTSDFSDLVKDLRRTAFRYRNGARKNAKRVAILIVDGKLDNPLNTLSEARRIREKKGVEIYVISVGNEEPQPEMMLMCDYPHQKHFYQVDNYDRLEDMRDTLVDVLCDEL